MISGRPLCVSGQVSSYRASNSEASSEGESSELETGGEGSAARVSQESCGCEDGSGLEREIGEAYPGEETSEPVSTMMVEEAVEPVRDIGIWEEESEAEEDFRSGRVSWRLLVPSCT
jgi:hypothetical protein